MRKEVMVKAWEIAKKAEKEYGHKASEYIREAMRVAWVIVKKEQQPKQRLFGDVSFSAIVPFGKAEAVVRVSAFRYNEKYNPLAPLSVVKKVAIRHEGKVLGRRYEAHSARVVDGMSKVGEAACHGEEAANEINRKIEEYVEEVERAYAKFMGREYVSKKDKELRSARSVIERAEKQVEILSESELASKKYKYDQLYNEAGEGYNPYRYMVSAEAYEAAKEIVQ